MYEALEAAQVMEGPSLRSLPTGVGSKPPRAALAEDHCREHRGKGIPMWYVRYESRRRVTTNHRRGVETDMLF